MRKDLIIWLMISSLCFHSCQRELHFPLVSSEGSLQKEGSGVCLPKSIQGEFIEGESLNSSSTMTVDVDVTGIGSYHIFSDTINGYHFEASGDFTSTGIHHVVLNASGNPVTSGINEFQIRYNNSTCQIEIEVQEPGGSGNTSAFTLAGSPDICIAVVNGSYMQGIALEASNTVTVSVNVTSVGDYSISTPAVNGITFSKSGTFTTTGVNTVVLNGSGTPLTAGNNLLPLTAGSSNCSFEVVVGNTATYDVACASVSVNGTYTAEASLNGSNTITFVTEASIPGSYSIVTDEINGMVFTSTGTMELGINEVTLTGSGIPLNEGTFIIHVPIGADGCDVSITVAPGISIDWEFVAGIAPNMITYSGTTNDAVQTMFNNQAILSIRGTSLDGIYNFSLTLSNTDGFINTGIYSGTANFGKFAAFSFSDPGPLLLLAGPTFASNLPAILTTYDTIGHFVQGTFDGFVSAGFGMSMQITYGKFKAHFP